MTVLKFDIQKENMEPNESESFKQGTECRKRSSRSGLVEIIRMPFFMLLFLLLAGHVKPGLFGQALLPGEPDAPSATRTASVSGNWNSTTTWGGQSVPASGDVVNINPGITVTVTANATCASLTFLATSATTSTVSVNTGITLTVTGQVKLNSATGNNSSCQVTGAGQLSCGSVLVGTNLAPTAIRTTIMSASIAALNITGNLTVSSYRGLSDTRLINSTFNLQSGVVDVNGNLAMTNENAVNTCTFTMASGAQSGTLRVSAASPFSVTTTGTANLVLNGTNSLVHYDGSNQTIRATTYTHLELSGSGTKTIAASTTVNVNGNLTNNSSFVLTVGTSTTSTWLVMKGDITNGLSGVIDASASYTRFMFNSDVAQTFTNNGSVVSPISSFDVSNTHPSGLTLAGTNGMTVTRANLFYGTVNNAGMITLGTGGTSYATVQRGVGGNTSPAGSFSGTPVSNPGTGGLILLYVNGSVPYATGTEVPSSRNCRLFYLFDAADVSLDADVIVDEELNFYGGTGTPSLTIGPHTLFLNGSITYTVAGNFSGGAGSGLVMNASTTLNGISEGLDRFIVNANVGLAGTVTVTDTLRLSGGTLDNGNFLTLADDAMIVRSGGALLEAPQFSGTVNLKYVGATPVTTGRELPAGPGVLTDLITSEGGVIQFAYNTNTSPILSEPFNDLNSWTGDIGTADGQFTTVASANAGGTSPEARYYGSLSHPASSTVYSIRTGPVNTSGMAAVNLSFRIMTTGNYTQNFPSYLKLMTSTSSTGPWHDAWSIPYAEMAAQTITVPHHTTDVGGDIYFRFVLEGDGYVTDYWYFDDFYVEGITYVATSSDLTVNGVLTLQDGPFTIGEGNTLRLHGGASGNQPLFGGSSANIIVGGTSSNLILPVMGSSISQFTVNRPAGVTIASGRTLTVSGTLTNNAGISGLIVASGGSLIQSTAGVQATVERFIDAWGAGYVGYHFLSSPMTAQAISSGFTTVPSTDYDFYAWWEATNTWVNYKNSVTAPVWTTANVLGGVSGGDNFIPGKGYLVEYRNAGTRQFKGTLNTSGVSAGNFVISTGVNRGWHLLGNPFPCALTWGTGDWSLSHINGIAKIWQENAGSYADVPSGTGVIPALNGFMVQVTDGYSGNNSLVIPAAARVHDATPWYKDGDIPGVKLVARDLTDNSFQESVVNFDNRSTQGFDPAYDARFLPGYAPLLRSVWDGEEFSTLSLPEAGGEVVVPFRFTKTDNGAFAIEAVRITGIAGPVYLEDLKTGTLRDLRVEPVYSFTSEQTDTPDRFRLSFTKVGLEGTSHNATPAVFANGTSICIAASGEWPAGSEVLVYNLLGQLVGRADLHGQSTTVTTPGTGYYIVKVIAGGVAGSFKVFIP